MQNYFDKNIHCLRAKSFIDFVCILKPLWNSYIFMKDYIQEKSVSCSQSDMSGHKLVINCSKYAYRWKN